LAESVQTPTAASDGHDGGTRQPPAAAVHPHGRMTWAFCICIGLGLIAEGYGSWQGAVAAIVLYFLYGLWTGQRLLSLDKFADSLYYAGFILTIWALILSLGPLGTHAEALTSSAIMTQFGIALVTTAVGITLRVLLLQSRHTLSDLENDARATIAEFVASLARETETTVRLLRDTRNRVLTETEDLSRHMEARLASMHESNQRQFASANGEFARAVQAHIDSIAPAVTLIAQRLESVELPSDIITARLDAAVAEIARELQTMRATLQHSSMSFTTSFDSGIAAFNSGKSSIEGISADLARIRSTLADVVEAVGKMGEVGRENIARAVDASRQHADVAQRFAIDAGEATKALRDLKRMAEDMADAVAKLNGATKSEVSSYHQQLHQQAESLQRSIQAAAADVTRFEKTMTESVAFLNDVMVHGDRGQS